MSVRRITDEDVPAPRILFATIGAGGSHVSSAQAMKEAVEAAYPGDFDLRISEPMQDYGFAGFDGRHKSAWRWALAHPWTIVWGQRLIDGMPALSVTVQRLMLRSFAERAARELRRDPPALIVANHGWLSTALTMSQRRFGLRVPVVTFQTSALQPTALWADPDVERVMVGSASAKDYMCRLGVPAGRIDVLGYPVRQAFLRALDKEAARQKLGLQNCFTCLVSLGGEGVGGRPREIVEALQQLACPVQIVVIAGRNLELQRDLAERTRPGSLLRVTGFVTNMAEFVAASDVVIGKTGPASVMEALAVGRPVLAPYRSGGVENRVMDFLEAHELGGYAPAPQLLQHAVAGFHQMPARLEAVRARTELFDFPGMASRIASYLAQYAHAGEAGATVAGPGLPWPATPVPAAPR